MFLILLQGTPVLPASAYILCFIPLATVIIGLVTLFVLTWANQTIQSATQSRVLASSRRGAAQANTVFMVGVFLGGSTGAFLGPIAYSAGGMAQVAVQAVIFVALAGLVWVVSYRYEQRLRRTTAVDNLSTATAAADSALRD